MKATFYICEPEKIECSMLVTMKLEEWIALQKLIPDQWPGWKLRGAITDMILLAQRSFSTPQVKD